MHLVESKKRWALIKKNSMKLHTQTKKKLWDNLFHVKERIYYNSKTTAYLKNQAQIAESEIN